MADTENKNISDNGVSMQQSVQFGGLSDGNMIVSFSENDLDLYANFTPAIGNGKPLDMDSVRTILEKINVTHGVQWDIISRVLDDCNSGRRKVNDVQIARGDPPVSEITEYYELNPLFAKSRQPVDRMARINYRERSPFTIVRKGQILAKLKPRKPGIEGKSVRGDLLPFGIVSPEGMTGGAKTKTVNNLIIAEIDGQLIIEKKMVSVQDNLVIKGAVGYGTGNIVFPGDVSIDGPVSDGFKIVSGGSLVIKQTLDLTEIIAKGDILVAGGIVGRGSGLLKSGGSIKTKFIENCQVAARKSVFVETGIINSNVYALGTVELGEKGMIRGGDIYAVHGVKAGGIGKKGGKPTRIHCGVDFASQQEKEKCNSQMQVLSAKLARLRELKNDPVPDREIQAKLEEMYNKLEIEQKAVSKRITELMGSINTDENAAVEVLGEISAGTLIEICQIALYLEQPLNKIRIRLDRAGGKLITESL